MSDVTLKNVTKTFDTVTAVDNVDITINEGELFTLLGPSGCGKTTILRMIAGFYYPTSGKVYFGDNDVTYLSANKRNTGMVFQNYALFPHLTVEENIAFGLKIRKTPKKTIKEKVNKVLEQVSLAGFEKRRIDQMSGGQQQRVALARALVIEPTILLLDEPLSNLDAKLREETRWEIRNLQKNLGITTIYVTHDQSEAMAMSDRIAVLNLGKIQQIGTPEEIYHRPANRFVASFIGKTNLIEGIIKGIQEEYIEISIGDEIIRATKENIQKDYKPQIGDKIAVSIRPEVIKESDEKTDNTITGKVVLSEFTGMNFEYQVKYQNFILHVAVPSATSQRKNAGDTITVNLPIDNLFIVR